jgi:hypothetical protein
VVLYLGSIVMLKVADRRAARRAKLEAETEVTQPFDQGLGIPS